MDKYEFRLRGDNKIIDVLTIEADDIGPAFAEARKIARKTRGVTQILYGLGCYTA